MLRGAAGLISWRLWYLGIVWVRAVLRDSSQAISVQHTFLVLL